MEYRTLGKTGLRVSALSFGASSLAGVFRPVAESEAIRSVHTALDLGINYIDVAPYYGLTKAETVLGKALDGVARDRYYLATKIGRYGLAEFDFSAERTVRSVDESLQRMGVDYLDVIQVHDFEYDDPERVVQETIPALRRIRERGKVRFVGITGYPLKGFRTVLDQTEVDTILSYNHYSLNDTTGIDPPVPRKPSSWNRQRVARFRRSVNEPGASVMASGAGRRTAVLCGSRRMGPRPGWRYRAIGNPV